MQSDKGIRRQHYCSNLADCNSCHSLTVRPYIHNTYTTYIHIYTEQIKCCICSARGANQQFSSVFSHTDTHGHTLNAICSSEQQNIRKHIFPHCIRRYNKFSRIISLCRVDAIKSLMNLYVSVEFVLLRMCLPLFLGFRLCLFLLLLLLSRSPFYPF